MHIPITTARMGRTCIPDSDQNESIHRVYVIIKDFAATEKVNSEATPCQSSHLHHTALSNIPVRRDLYFAAMLQKKSCWIPSNRKTRNCRRRNHERRRSPRRRDISNAPAATTTPIARSALLQKYKTIGRHVWPNALSVRLPDVDLTWPPKVEDRRLRPLTPPLTSTTPSEPRLHEDILTFPYPSPRKQDDDTASQGSMTTRRGDKDGEILPSAKGRSFNFDWADKEADEPPIPWEQVQSYTDFHDNKAAHEYWQWDRREMKWRHVDAETGEVLYCPAELD